VNSVVRVQSSNRATAVRNPTFSWVVDRYPRPVDRLRQSTIY
jgi:hypothetical protein